MTNTAMKTELLPLPIWFIIKHPGVAKGEWTTDNIESFLNHLAQQTAGATVYAVWSEHPDKNPMTNAENTPRNEALMENGTAINMADFVQACIRNKTLMATHRELLVKLIAYASGELVNGSAETFAQINNAMLAA